MATTSLVLNSAVMYIAIALAFVLFVAQIVKSFYDSPADVLQRSFKDNGGPKAFRGKVALITVRK